MRLSDWWGSALVSVLAMAFYASDTVASDATVDTDGNGLQDRYEASLAARFVPAMVLDSRDNVSPEAVNFVGGHTMDSLWVKLYDLAGTNYFNGSKLVQDVNPSGWNPPLVGASANSVIRSNGNFSGIATPMLYSGTPGYSDASGIRGHYILYFHFEYSAGDSPTSWHSSYQAEAEGNLHADQVYVHLFKRPGETRLVQRPPPLEPITEVRDDEYVMQYWYFYPFNDWVNNHRGRLGAHQRCC